MTLIEKANEECMKLRVEKNPYKAPELFPDPPIQSNQMLGSLYVIQEEFKKLKKRITDLEKIVLKKNKKKKIS